MPARAHAIAALAALFSIASWGTEAVAAPLDSELLGALRDDQDVILLPSARRPEPAPTIVGATLAPGLRPERIGAVLLDPDAMRAALPSLVRAEVLATRASSSGAAAAGPTVVRDRLIAWEIEIPFFNLTGKAWLVHRGESVDLELVEGAFAPGRVRFTARSAPANQAVLVTCETRIDFRSANWILRRLARHDPWAETAMAAAANWVLMRAVALRAGARDGTPAPRPSGPMAPPALALIRGDEVARDTLSSLRERGRVALVRRGATGRLAFVSVGAVLDDPAPGVVERRLSAPESWLPFPGWKSVRRHPADPTLFDVADNIALVDLDATWRWSEGASARAVAGSITGAALRWDFWPLPPTRTARVLATLSTYPRLDAAGFIERRMVAAEPLLEHALALAMAYADLAAAVDAVGP
jgi:hypothetical protein